MDRFILFRGSIHKFILTLPTYLTFMLECTFELVARHAISHGALYDNGQHKFYLVLPGA